MPLDQISDEIAHFIGLFHLGIEGHRLRQEYDAFALEQDEVPDDPDQMPDLVVAAPYTLKGFNPKLVYQPPPHFPEDFSTPPYPVLGSPDENRLSLQISDSVQPEDGQAWFPSNVIWLPYVPVPNSILVLIGQRSELWDNDLLLVTGKTEFVDPEVLIAEFLKFVDLAVGQSAFGPDGVVMGTVPKVDEALVLKEQITAFAPNGSAAEVQLLLRGEDALGAYVNGEKLEPVASEGEETGQELGEETDPDPNGLPDFLDLLPAYLAAKRDAREAETDAKEIAPAMPSDGTTDAPDTIFAVDPGHKVVTGANLATNETSIIQAWVDAPVIAVAGDMVRLDVVSQVNVMIGAATSFGGTAALPSQMLNAVSLEYESSFDPENTPPPASGMFPESWSVVTITGDVFAVNWIKQHIFATDFDRAEITITAAATYIGTGENMIGNAVQLVEFGFHYDLILVGGHMIALNVVDQINVLLDVDSVGGSIFSPISHHAGDNLQYNRAELKQTGIDEATELQDNFRTALDEMAEGAGTISHDVAQDARFEGKSALKVLYIDGDLIKANIIEQHNYLGDSDQVQLMLDDFLDSTGPVQLVSGSNAQLNAARIHDIGIDSEVMVGGSAYSDALIYQAQLVDGDAPPNGVGLVPLANEAVAFLADDMLGASPEYVSGLAATVPEHPASSDVLHAIIT